MLASSCSKYKYETVSGDRLENPDLHASKRPESLYERYEGAAPHPDGYIAVRVGVRRTTPLETTGLAHYFEHLMFKGTEVVRHVQDYAAERPDARRDRAAVRGLPQDHGPTPTNARAIYAPHRLDRLRGFEAGDSQRVRQADGRPSAPTGTNAFTSQDMTVYVEDIPSNQIDNWAKIQSDRFRESRDPRIPHRAGDHLRGEKHVADAGQPQNLGGDGRRALPQPSLRHADRAGNAGEPRRTRRSPTSRTTTRPTTCPTTWPSASRATSIPTR